MHIKVIKEKTVGYGNHFRMGFLLNKNIKTTHRVFCHIVKVLHGLAAQCPHKAATNRQHDQVVT